MTDRDERTARLIDSLSRITTARGATPHEAEAAAAKMDRLRELYGVPPIAHHAALVGLTERAWFDGSIGRRRSGRVPVTRYALPGIEAACNVVASWHSGRGELAFFGAFGDCRRAHIWQEAIRSAIDVAYVSYSARAPRVPGESGAARSARFKRATAERINARLIALVDDRDDYRAALRAAFADQYDSRGCAGSILITAPTPSMRAGAGAGDRISLSRGAPDPIADPIKLLEGPTE